MILIKNVEKRDDYPIFNRYEFINDSNDDMHHVIYYKDENKFQIIVRRLDKDCGWGVNLKIKIYSLYNNDCEIISIGSCHKNCKIMNIYCNVILKKITFSNQSIPKIIVQTTYKTEIHNILHYNSIQTYIELNPEYEYRIFDNNSSRLFIKENFDETILDAYDLLIPGAFKADFFRYCFLYIHGGCYFDCKSILRYPLRDIINRNDTFLICKDIVEEGFFNAVIVSIPRNYLLLKIINECKENIIHYHELYIYNMKKSIYEKPATMFSLTGPMLMYNCIKNDVQFNNIAFFHRNNNNNNHHKKHDYLHLYVEYNGKHIITKQYNMYHSSSGIHYSHQWMNKEVVYTLHNKINHYKFYIYSSNNNEKFHFYTISSNTFKIKRIDKNVGWNDNLKIKIINEKTNKELILNVNHSTSNEKIIELNEHFL
jgi:mannosyltransferase OCH1-like enzyme